jgi:prepilin-type N-terminal cleavage/methylation domain-containing protein
MTKTPQPATPVRGFSLVEMLMVVVIIGIMLRFGLPYFRTANTKADVRSAADLVSSLHATTKQAAVQRGRVSQLIMDRTNQTMVVVANKVTGSGVDTVGSVQSLSSRFGVAFSTSPTRDTLMFTPRGLGVESSDTRIIIAKGSFRDTLIISSAGRLMR